MFYDLASYFSSAIIQSTLLLNDFDNDENLRNDRLEFCLDYFTSLSNSINRNGEYQDTIKWIICKNNESYGCVVVCIFDKELQVFKDTSKVVDVLTKMKNNENVLWIEWKKADDVIHELKKIVIG